MKQRQLQLHGEIDVCDEIDHANRMSTTKNQNKCLVVTVNFT